MPSKLKIIFVTHLFPVASETFVVSNVIEAINQGYDVGVLVDRINPIKRGSQAKQIEEYDVMRLVSKVKHPQNKIKRFANALLYLLNPVLFCYFIKYCFITLRISLSYIFILKSYKPYRNADAFHIHFANNAVEVSTLKRIGYIHSKILVTFHGFDAHYKNKEEQQALIKQYKPFYKVWDKVTTNTLFLKNIISSLDCPENKIELIPMAIDLKFYNPITHPKSIDNIKQINIVSVGRLIEIKGHQYGINAVKCLIDKGFNIKYTIIGNGILYEALQTLIIELKLEKHVILFGQATQDEVKEILEISHLFLMTSVKDTKGREESQGLVTAEAQAMGLPIVGFNSGGIPYTVTEETSILVAEKNTKALALAVMKIIEAPEKYKVMSAEAKKWANSQYGLSKMVARYYENLI